MIPRLLIVEDEGYRAAWFLQRFRDCAVTLTNSAPAAIEALEHAEECREGFNYVFLDHDLVGHPSLGCGRDVAARVIQRRFGWPSVALDFVAVNFVVHSVNDVSGTKIHRELREAGLRVTRVPFPLLMERLGEAREGLAPLEALFPPVLPMALA